MGLVLPLAVIWLGYLISLVIYRLYLSPLAKFPGPKLAALSKWYEMYFEVVKKGHFNFHIQDLHRKYGPIVRITPEEVHIDDSPFWDVLYVRQQRAAKYEWSSARFANSSSVFTTSDHSLHRLRRGALNPMFSKQAIRKVEPLVQQKEIDLCRKIAEYKDTGKALVINRAFSCFAGDIITEYSFGFGYSHLESEDFEESLHDGFMAISRFGHIALQFPWIPPIVNSLPDSWNKRLNPPLEKLLQLQRDLRSTIARIISEISGGKASPENTTIFHTIIQSDMPPAEKTPHRLGEEAQLVIGAGVETTAWALSNAVFYILSSEQIHKTLRAELRAAIPDPSVPGAFDLQRMEQLPYLRGCVKEGIRFSLGVSARNQRVLDVPLAYAKWVIPAFTPVSMTIYDVSFDEKIWERAHEYMPERWMGDSPKALDGTSLDHYFVSFGKGPRSCLGINLAYMELYTALARIFRMFRLELFETDKSDVELAHDFFLPSPKLNSKGVRVKVLDVEK